MHQLSITTGVEIC